VDSTNFIIGDRFQLYLHANHPQNATLQVDLSPLQAVENLDIEAESPWDTTVNGSALSLQKTLTLQVWDSGYYWIPEIPFNAQENGSTHTLKTNKIPITVNNVALADSIQLADIKDIIREKANWEDYILYPALLLFLLLAYGIYYFLKKRKEQKAAPPPPPVQLPAHEIALNALGQLKGEKLWQQGNIKAYQSRLTYIIREYLENRYNIPALESTTDQILRHLKKVDFDNNWKDKLQNILQVADLVKFAKAKPPADFHDQVWAEAENFVIATKVKPIIVEETTENTEETAAASVEDSNNDK
jgi:hypothetical protein